MLLATTGADTQEDSVDEDAVERQHLAAILDIGRGRNGDRHLSRCRGEAHRRRSSSTCFACWPAGAQIGLVPSVNGLRAAAESIMSASAMEKLSDGHGLDCGPSELVGSCLLALLLSSHSHQWFRFAICYNVRRSNSTLGERPGSSRARDLLRTSQHHHLPPSAAMNSSTSATSSESMAS